MTKESQLAIHETDAPALVPIAQDPIVQMLQGVIDKGVTEQNVAALEKLADLYERMQAKEAEKAFNSAFVKLQSELPVIVAKTVIPNRGKYEKFEDVMEAIGRPLRDNGFSLSFSQDFKEGRILETCTLRHIGGHSQANTFAVRTGGKADSDTQADCKAATTAKRNALLNALNIVIRQDVLQSEDDARNDGEPISWEKAEYLRSLVKETGSDEAAFLKYAGAETYEEIGSAHYDRLAATLHRKQKQ